MTLLQTCLVPIVLTAGLADASEPATQNPVDVFLKTIETIHGQHVDPPTRQELTLAIARAVYRHATPSVPAGLARRLESFANGRAFLESVVADAGPRLESVKLEDIIADPLVARVVSGPFEVLNRNDARVAEQFRANRYVGIGIALSRSPSRNNPSRPGERRRSFAMMGRVIPGGPSDKVGAVDGTVIETIDGDSTEGMSIQEIVNRLRGEEGTIVMLGLRKPTEETATETELTRGVVPFKSISELNVDSKTRFGFLRIQRIAASTAHELRAVDKQVRDQNVEGLILDLRRTQPGSVHHAVLLADQFLTSGRIGRLVTGHGQRIFEATSDRLFRDIPIVVLIGPETRGTAEWLASAFQDSKRSVLIGTATAGDGYTSDYVEVPDSGLSLQMATGLLLRSNGRDLRGHQDRSASLRQVASPGRVQRPNIIMSGFVTPNHGTPRRLAADAAAGTQNDPAYGIAVQVLNGGFPQSGRPVLAR